MQKQFGSIPLYRVTQQLTAVATGRIPADTVIRGGQVVNVCTAEIIRADVAISAGRIALVGDASRCIGEKTRVVDAAGRYIAPGFLDGHIHIESSMLSVGEYARAVVPHGTTGVYIDPHEICNVLGLDGVRWMLEDAARTPLKVMVTTPSCVPAVPGFEDTGGRITPQDIACSMDWPSVIGLGEMMNYPGVLNGADTVHAEIAATLQAGGIVTGHFPVSNAGGDLDGYIAAGIRCCHESTTAADALEKMRRGMYAQIREGSAWHDLHAVLPAVTAHQVDSRFACLVSDDAHPHTLVENGHLDYIARRAVAEGLDPITAIQMVTINTAQCFQMDQDLGSVTPGKCADLVLLEDLQNITVSSVWINGRVIAENGRYLPKLPPYRYPEQALHSMHVGGTITPESFAIAAPDVQQTAHVQAIEIIPERVSTRKIIAPVPVKDGLALADVQQDLLKAAVFERHKATGKAGFGFVKGFGIRAGAMASTVAHDAHNLLVIGANDADMALAANTLIQCGGGMCTVRGGQVLGLVELPIAGLMQELSAEEMSARVAALAESWKAIGCSVASPFMTMALIPLACLPELRLTNRGLVDCTTFAFTPLFVE